MAVEIDFDAAEVSTGSPLRRPEPNGRKNGKSRVFQALRKLHFCTGAILAVNFILLVVTGYLVQHRDLFRLERRTISRHWLPAGYRPNDPDTEIRADIVITDLHSGRLFGPKGPLVVDLAAAGLLLMIASGFAVQISCKYKNGRRNGS